MHQTNKYATPCKSDRQSGFTLIELVIVIVILGVLAATALPRFFDLTGDARKAAVAGVAGAFTTGVVGEHSKWTIDGSPPGTYQNGPCTSTVTSTSATSTCDLGYSVTIDGNSIGFNSFGYPTTVTSLATPVLAVSTGMMTLTDTICMNIWTAVLASNRPTITTQTLASTTASPAYPGGFDWAAGASTDSMTCTFTYYGGANKATTRKIVYTLQNGQIVLTNI